MTEKVDKRRTRGPSPTEKKKALLKQKAAEFDKKHGLMVPRDEKGRFGPGNPYGGFKEHAPGGCPEIYTEEWLEEELKAMAEWVQNPRNIWLNKFCAQRGYLYKRVQEAVKKYPRFSETLEMINSLLHSTWVEGASFKKMSEGMAKAFLTQWKVMADTPTTVVLKRDDPISLAVEEAMDNSKDLVNERARDSSSTTK